MNLDQSFPAPAAPSSDGLIANMHAEDIFSFDALLIHTWLSQLLDEAVELYVARRTSRFFGMQTGQAQRAFLRVFGHPNDNDFHRIIQSMYRFTTCEDPLAIILFRALDAVTAEHEAQGDFTGFRTPEGAERPLEAVRWMRESMDRWLDWVDAFIHVQTHAQWHLTPDCFDSDPAKRDQALQAQKQRRLEQSVSSANWRSSTAETTRFYRELPIWQVVPQARISQPQRPWPHPEIDEAIITLWPLVKRHHWSCADLLTVLKDVLPEPDAFPSEDERKLATYCLHTLRLRKSVQGRTAKRERPAGYVVALRLVPPMPPRPIFYFGSEDNQDLV